MLEQEETVIKQSIETLKQLDKLGQAKKAEDQKLLGLPSFEECVQSNSVKKDDEMMRFERRLRSLVFSGIDPRSSKTLFEPTEKHLMSQRDAAK